jgi:cytidylate kinase
LYRIVAVSAQSQAIDLADENALVAMVADLQIAFIGDKVDVNGSDLSDIIRTEETGVAASQVAALPGVRDAILALQKSFQRAPGLVADGRDMGTVVFPHSKAKIFLDASAEARADRRYKQLKNKGLSVNLRDLLEQIQERDARDRGRAVAPLKPAADALIIDSTQMTIEEVLETIMTEVSKGYL